MSTEPTPTVLKWKRTGDGTYESEHNDTTFRVVRINASHYRLWNLFIDGTCDDSFCTKREAQLSAEMFVEGCSL